MSRAFLSIQGADRVHFLQGILTQDVTRLEADRLQFSALLSPQGKILHDMFLLHLPEAILIDTDAALAPTLLKRLAMYKLRAKITIADASAGWSVALGGDGLPDPRHPALPCRTYAPHRPAVATCAEPPTLALGIPELGRDFAPDQVVLLDAGYDLLNAVSFTKGCYVGQEITARMHYKAIARRGFYLLKNDSGECRLALLRFDEAGDDGRDIAVDNRRWHATLPAWLRPKYAQFADEQKKQP